MPVHQMFPEMAGYEGTSFFDYLFNKFINLFYFYVSFKYNVYIFRYEGAVPSKRDLQALFKALQSELVSAAVEGDLSLLKSTCKEMQKAIQLVVAKV